jgi:hypothetical protein
MTSKDVEDFFKMAGTVRGAIWLLLVLNENAAPAADTEGWRLCSQGRLCSDEMFGRILGASVEKAAEWRERLSSLGMIRFVDLGEGRRIWLHKKYNHLFGSLKDDDLERPVN